MENMRNLVIVILLLLPFSLLAQKTFPYPDVPATLKSEKARANYLGEHYWDRYDFRNNALIGNKDISEHGFVNFIGIVSDATAKDAAFESFTSKVVANNHMLQYFMGLAAKYLSDPSSSLYDDELYILFLEKIIARKGIAEREFENAKFNLSMAKKNRIGSKAANFTYLQRDGKRGELLKTKGKYILLFMGDPECDLCTDVKKELMANHFLNKCIADETLTVLSVCVEGKTEAWEQTPAPDKWIDACDDTQMIFGEMLYDIPGLPVLYLLDKNHKVIMKNVQLFQIEQFFRK